MSRSTSSPAVDSVAGHGRLPDGRQPAARVPALWLGLLAAPVAIGTTGPSLILAEIGADLGVPARTASWLVIAYGWAIAVGTPLFGGLIRHRGIRVGLLAGVALVLGGTVLVAAVPWLPAALLGRVAQGAGCTGFVTIAMSLAGSTRRMGVIAAGLSMCGALGPLVGARLTDALSWRLPLSLCALSLLAVPVVIRAAGRREPSGESGQKIDLRGACLLFALVTALVFVPRFPLPAVAGTACAAALLALHVRGRPDGFVPMAMLRTPVFLFSSVLAFLLATSSFAQLYAVPELLDRARWSADRIGVAQLVALIIGSAVALLLAAGAGRLRRATVVILIVTPGVAALTLTVTTPWLALLPAAAGLAVLAASAGQGILAVFATGSVSAAHRSTAIGLFNLCYQLGGAFGPAIVAQLLL